MAAESRRLAAIMFTDMVGHTALAQANETLAIALLDRHRRLLRPLFPSYGGVEVKTIGDGFLVEFSSALDATCCALEIQRQLHEYNTRSSENEHISLRIGVHLGDVLHEGTDIRGDAVNVASRLEPLADPGGVCISEQVFSQVRNKIPNRLVKLTPRDLKGVQFPLEVYRVIPQWEEASSLVRRALRGSESVHRLAVLPFTNMSPDPQDEYFADGLTEEIITELSRLPGLDVIARTTMMLYKTGPKSVREVGHELNVDLALEGSVRKAGNRIRVTAQLVDAGSEGHLWANRFDRELTDVFAVQTEIAGRVAEHLGVALGRRRPSGRPPSGNMDAYLLYLRGRFLWNRRTLRPVQQALRAFEEAVSKDPGYPEAHSGLADCYLILVNNLEETAWSEAGPKAMAAASRAVQLDDQLAEAHASLGLAFNLDYQWGAAERELRRALELKPGYAPGHLWYSLLLLSLGRLEDAEKELLQAAELDPLSPVVLHNLGVVAAVHGRWEEALRHFDQAVEVEPGFAEFAPLFKIPLLMERGRADEAAAAFSTLMETWGSGGGSLEDRYTWAPAAAMAAVGRTDEARQSLDRLLDVAKRSYVSAAGIARIFAALGDPDRFFEWSARSIDEHSTDPFFLRTHPAYAPVRQDPRFAELFGRLGLPRP